MLTADNTGGLVAGASAPAAASGVRVRLIANVWIGGELLEPGVELDVARGFAAELVSAGKAERVPPAAPTVEGAEE